MATLHIENINEELIKNYQITSLEAKQKIKQIIETVLRHGVPAAAMFWGFNMPIEISVAAPVIADYIIKQVTRSLLIGNNLIIYFYLELHH